MPVIDVRKDLQAATVVVIAEFDAAIDRVWQLWADPRQLERWWGPPTHPATVTAHDLTAGGEVRYHMTGPDGGLYPGMWRVVAVRPPTRLETEDLFVGEDGQPDTAMPVSGMVVELAERAHGGTRVVITSSYASPEAMAQVIDMGMEEGMRAAMAQVDDLLAEPTPASG